MSGIKKGEAPKPGEFEPLVRALVVPGSLNEDERTVEVTWATNTRVLRHSWQLDGYYWEELVVSRAACDLTRLNAGAPFLNAHWGQDDARGIMGAVVKKSAKIVDGQGLATIRFDTAENDPDAEKVFNKIKREIINGISVGYRVLEIKKTKELVDEIPVYRVTKWEPFEVSVAPIPADLESKFRSFNMSGIKKTTGTNEETTDEAPAPEVVRAAPVVVSPPLAPVATAPDLSAVRTEERARSAAILTAVRATNLGDEFAAQLIASNGDLVACRSQILDAIMKRDDASNLPSGSVTRDAVDIGINSARSGIASAIEYRAGIGALNEAGREFSGLSMLEMARHYLLMQNIDVRGLGPAKLAQTALGVRSAGHTTSDFPLILADVANKQLAGTYAELPQTFAPLARRETLKDFKTSNIVSFGDAPSLLKVEEGGEYQQGTIGEGKEAYRLFKYGRRFVYTWELMVNDDLSALTRLPEMFARKARILEGNLAWAQILGNPVMGDGVALFHATHGNLGTATAFGEAGLSDGRSKMRKQLSIDKDPLNISPRFLIGGPDLETKFDKELTTVSPAKSTDVNPFSGKLEKIIETRITSSIEYYLAAAPGACDVLVIAYLLGEDGPVMETRSGFEVDGFEMKCRLVFGAKAGDFRGLYKNPGA